MGAMIFKAVAMSLIRRSLGYAGIAAAVSPALADGVFSSIGGLVAAATVVWSIYGKIKAAR